MLIKELIEKLKKCNPEMPVRIECWQDCKPTGVFKVSSQDGQPDRIYIADAMHYFDDDENEVGYTYKEVL